MRMVKPMCINGHTGMAKVLVDADAEVEARCVRMCVCVCVGGGVGVSLVAEWFVLWALNQKFGSSSVIIFHPTM